MQCKLELKEMVFIALFAALTAVSSYIVIPLPFSPVPITAQTLIVMLAGSTLKPRTAFMSMIVFLFLGICGLPIFSGGRSGIGTLLGPTGGYLISWPIAVAVMSTILKKIKPTFKSLLLINFLGGVLIIYVIGIFHLSLLTGTKISQAFAMGALPFIPGDLAKVVLASSLSLSLRRVMIY